MSDTPAGRIIWLSGAPGMGKSTSAQLLARSQGYVYYEADCFASMKNPFVPLHVDNPSLAQLTQKPLKDRLVNSRSEIVMKLTPAFLCCALIFMPNVGKNFG